jgi:hypothetical protein
MFATFAVLFPGEKDVFNVLFQMEKPHYQRVLAGVAQLVEQLICNQLVGGSSPFSGSVH